MTGHESVVRLDLPFTYLQRLCKKHEVFAFPVGTNDNVRRPFDLTELSRGTLNKSDKEDTKTTLYKDYSISSTLFHWQSQSTTSVTSETGQRYINHKQRGSRVLLFVREQKKDSFSGKAREYTFLGEASYVSHQGSHPMSIIWKLDHTIPARFLVKTNKMTQE